MKWENIGKTGVANFRGLKIKNEKKITLTWSRI